jgi:peptidoglycan/LPS O-acetylase OafA/YrhL
MGARDRIEILDGLRGFAALWVAWFHFTHGSGLFQAGPVLASGNYGWLGVEIFFAISGFVNLAGRLPEAWHAPALAVALGVSLVSAYAFYRLIELPSQRLSKHVSYRRRPAPARGLAEAA